MGQTLADGQLASGVPGVLYTGASSVSIVNVVLCNVSDEATEEVTLRVTRQGGAPRRILRCVLAPNEQAYVRGLPLDKGEILDGVTGDKAAETRAEKAAADRAEMTASARAEESAGVKARKHSLLSGTSTSPSDEGNPVVLPPDVKLPPAAGVSEVDFTISRGTGEFGVTVLDASGSVRQSNTPAPVAAIHLNPTTSLYDTPTASHLEAHPHGTHADPRPWGQDDPRPWGHASPTDVYGPNVTLDVTKEHHTLYASHARAANCTLTPSGPGNAGDRVKITTEADDSGAVAVTFAAPFYSSGVQTTHPSQSSTIEFVSDGSRLMEKSRG